jgi:hypothetical protein
MHRITIVAFLVCVASFGASPQSHTKQSTPFAPSLKARIPAPKRSIYGALRDATDWKNPFLIAKEDGIEIRKKGDDYAAPVVSVEEAMRFLEHLPKSAWPYGLVVGVEEQSVCCRYSDGEASFHANRVALLSRLKRAGIVVSLWPSG